MINKLKIILLLISHNFLILNGNNFLDITQYGYEQYQDIIINNEVVKPATGSRRDCQSRYDIINSVLEEYKRPFTVFDIGASQGYYSFRIAHDYPESVCVMLDGNNPSYPMTGDQLESLCYANNTLSNIILLKKQAFIPDLKRISECECFDVVIALNIVHRLGNRWKEGIDAMVNMSDNIIIETPPVETQVSEAGNKKRKDIENYLTNEKHAKIIGQVKRHTSDTFSNVYLIERNKDLLQRKTWISPLSQARKYTLESNYHEKKLVKYINDKKILVSDWIPGINLITYAHYNGCFPSKVIVKSSIKGLITIPSNDWMPNNMIVQGNRISLIDDKDPRHGKIESLSTNRKQIVQKIFKWLDNPNDHTTMVQLFGVKWANIFQNELNSNRK